MKQNRRPSPKRDIDKIACFANQLENVPLYSINGVGTIGSPYGKILNEIPTSYSKINFATLDS